MSDSIGTGPRCRHGLRGGCALCAEAELRDAFRDLVEAVEHEWRKLRVPELVKRNPPALVGSRLRRAAEKARERLGS